MRQFFTGHGPGQRVPKLPNCFQHRGKRLSRRDQPHANGYCDFDSAVPALPIALRDQHGQWVH